MNKEDFVSLECAKLLKKKGFDELCYAYYFGENFILKNGLYRGDNIESIRQVPLFPNCIEAPTLYDVAKWLRDSHKIQIGIYVEKINLWHYKVQTFCEFRCKKFDMEGFATYEEALNVGIMEALKLI